MCECKDAQSRDYCLPTHECDSLMKETGSPPRTKKLGRMMRRHMKKNMEMLSGVDNHQWQCRACCKDYCYFYLFVFFCRTVLSTDTSYA